MENRINSFFDKNKSKEQKIPENLREQAIELKDKLEVFLTENEDDLKDLSVEEIKKRVDEFVKEQGFSVEVEMIYKKFSESLSFEKLVGDSTTDERAFLCIADLSEQLATSLLMLSKSNNTHAEAFKKLIDTGVKFEDEFQEAVVYKALRYAFRIKNGGISA